MTKNPMRELIQQLRRGSLLRDGTGLTDGKLLEEYIRCRDEAALEALVHRHGPMVWGVCRRLLQDYHDTEDAFQATFLVLVRRAPSVRRREMVGNWLYGVAHQTALKARATIGTRKVRERQVVEIPEPAVLDQAQWDDVRAVLDEELSRLPEKYRAVVVLCDLQGRTRKETAKELGIPEGTVAGWIARAREMLSQRLTQRGVTLSGSAVATLLAQNVASASVPNSVLTCTIKVTTLVAAGQTVSSGVLSFEVTALTESVLKAMMTSKLKAFVSLVLMLGVFSLGTTVLSYHTESVQSDPVQGMENPEEQSKQGRDALIPDEPKVSKRDLIDKWKGMFGEKLDFAEKPLFDCMVYLGPQPMSRLQDFRDKQLSEGAINYCARWMEGFFKPEYRPDVRKIRPKKYYLPRGKEPGLLYYEWKAEECSLSMSENFNGILLQVKPVDFDANKGIAGKDLAGLLLKMLNLKGTGVPEIIADFHLPETGRYGDVFANARPLRISFIAGWKDHVVVFLSKDSICVLCFKAVAGRAEVGFRYDNQWLSRNLFKNDGKPLAVPPKRQTDPLPPEERKEVNEAIDRAQAQALETEKQAKIKLYLDKLADHSDNTNQYRYIFLLQSMNLRPSEGVPIFTRLLENKSDVVKQGSLNALGEYGPQAKSAVPAITKVLENSDKAPSFLASAAALALAKTGPSRAAVDVLVRELVKPNRPDSVRENTMTALGILGPLAKDAIDPMKGFLHDENRTSDMRYIAYRSIGIIRGGGNRLTLADLHKLKNISWDQPESGYPVFEAVQREGRRASFLIPQLLELLETKPPLHLQAFAIQSLGSTGGGGNKAVVRPLVNGIASPDSFVSRISEEAMDRIDGSMSPAFALFAKALAHSNTKVRRHAANALRRFGPAAKEATKQLVEALLRADDSTDLQEIAAELDALKAVGKHAPNSAGAAEKLAELLAKQNNIYKGRSPSDVDRLRAYILAVVAELGTPKSALPYILDELNAYDNSGRAEGFAAAAMAASSLGAIAKPAVRPLMQALRPEFRDRGVSLDQFLGGGYGNYSTSARLEAIRALRTIGPAAREALPLLKAFVAQTNLPGGVEQEMFLLGQHEAKRAVKAIESN